MSFQESSISTGYNEISSRIQTSALKATRNSLLLPPDINFHRTMDLEFSTDLDMFSSRILSIANQVLTFIGTADSSTESKSKLESGDDVVDNFHSIVVDAMDQMMERTDMSLDEFFGRNKAPAITVNANSSSIVIKNKANKGALHPLIQHASHLPKPQLNFKKKVVNNDVPWYPSLSHKYNAQVPLDSNFQEPDPQVEGCSPIKLHPYHYEITHISYPSRMFQSSQPVPPTSFKSTTFKWVANVVELESMLDDLRRAPEIAVDLERHSYRSYSGFLCLMQISTRQQDWIIDLLALREELAVLNEVFTDPKITKVFHGAEGDIVWLQQDLDIYIVNLFDTFHASKALGFPRHGLANLLEMFCDFTPDKRYQLADWRIRPLPQEMLDYARSDTHFLLYIYDNLRNALLDRAVPNGTSLSSEDTSSESYFPVQALIHQVLTKSEATSLRVYEKECYDIEGGSGGNGWDTLARKWNKKNLYANSLSVGTAGIQKDIYIRIHLWRDVVAREEDESVRYVLPNHHLFQLAEQPPSDIASMLKIFHFVPPILRRRAKELLFAIQEVVRQHATSIEERSTQDAAAPREPPVLVEQPYPQNRLWTLDSSFANDSVSSSLFQTEKQNPSVSGNHTTGMFAPRSTLFGETLPSTNTRASASLAASLPFDRFAEIVARIHSTLVIAPSALNASRVSVHQAKKITLGLESNLEQSVSADTHDDEILLPSVAQAEMPPVPSAQRGINASTAMPLEDNIVMVGQARQRKRKRGKTIPNLGEGKTKESDGGTVPFDFSSAPDILDAAPTTEQTVIPRKKPKQGKVRSAFSGDFPAPPKAYNEVKSGNKSHTFK